MQEWEILGRRRGWGDLEFVDGAEDLSRGSRQSVRMKEVAPVHVRKKEMGYES
jgi:hypothetical protein